MAASHRCRSWMAFTTIIVEFSFRHRQPIAGLLPAAICSPPQCQEARHCGDGRGLRPNRHIKHERFPRSRFPPKQCWRPRCGSLFQAAAAKYRFCLCFSRPGQRSWNIVLVATVDVVKAMQASGIPCAARRGSQWALFNRKGQEPDSRFAHF